MPARGQEGLEPVDHSSGAVVFRRISVNPLALLKKHYDLGANSVQPQGGLKLHCLKRLRAVVEHAAVRQRRCFDSRCEHHRATRKTVARVVLHVRHEDHVAKGGNVVQKPLRNPLGIKTVRHRGRKAIIFCYQLGRKLWAI